MLTPPDPEKVTDQFTIFTQILSRAPPKRSTPTQKSPSPAWSSDWDQRILYLCTALKALTSCYCPNYKIDSIFSRLKEKLLLPTATLTLIPGQAIISVVPDTDSAKHSDHSPFSLKSFNIKTSGGLNMLKLEAIEILIESLCTGYYDAEADLGPAQRELEDLMAFASIYPDWLKIFAFGALCIGATPMFGGGVIECVFSFVFGCLFGALLLKVLPKVPKSESSFLFWSSAIFSLGTRLAMELMLKVNSDLRGSGLFHGVHLNYMSVILPPIIWILPGFSMINGFTDFLTGQKTLGISNIFNALFTAFAIGFGMLLGFNLPFIKDIPVVEHEFLPERLSLLNSLDTHQLIGLGHRLSPAVKMLFDLVAFAVCIFPISITFDCHPKQMPVVMLVSTLSFWASSATSLATEKLVGFHDCIPNFVGGFVAGILSALWSWVSGYSTTPGIFLGIVILAPGTWGARCFFHGCKMNLEQCGRFGFGMIAISLAIAVGTLMGRALFPVRK